MIDLSVIQSIAKIKKYPPGCVLTGDGTDNILLVVIGGDIGVYVQGPEPPELLSVLGTGDVFADPALMQNKHALYTTKTLSDAVVLLLEKDAAVAFIRDEPALAFELIKHLYLRLDKTAGDLKSLLVRHDREQRAERLKSDNLQM